MGCHSDSHTVTKENQFQEQSLSEEYMFCRHLTTQTSRKYEIQDSMVRARVTASEGESDF